MNNRLLAVMGVVCVAAASGLAGAQVFGPVGRGGVVGDGPATSTRAAPLASRPAPLNLGPSVLVPEPSSLPADKPDPIDRPEFQSKAHPVVKNVASATAMMIQEAPDGSEVGVVSDVIAAVAAGSRDQKLSSAVFVTKQAAVGPEMKTSFDEAVRAVHVRYPTWEPARIEFSFGDKYTPHEGGSAGTAFAALMLSELEGFEIDSKTAVTGDITVNWKVKKIGGLVAKLRGAAAGKCTYAGIPVDNADEVGDLALLYGDGALRDIQVFSLETLQDAVALLRTDRAPRLAAAMKAFDELQPRLKQGKPALQDASTQKSLEGILALAPNHQSAKYLLAIGKGNAPKALTMICAMEQIGVLLSPYDEAIIRLRMGQPITRTTVSAATTAASRKMINQLTPIMPSELQPLLTDIRGIVDNSESMATNTSPTNPARQRMIETMRNFSTHARALEANKEFVEKFIRAMQ